MIDTAIVETKNDDEVTAKEEEKKLINFEILRLIKDAQQQHGLRHSDFQRYRSYCTRKIRRLRKTLHIPQGDKRHYKRRDVTESHLNESKFLLIPLMQSERAWSYAMQLRQEANTEPRKRFHLIARLRKAVVHANLLHALSQCQICDTRTELEAQAYAAWIEGTLLFELQKWQAAGDKFNQALVVYSRLAEASNEEVAAVYRQRCDELQPSLRYCAYSGGDTSAIADLRNLQSGLVADQHILDKLDAMMDEAAGRGKEAVEEVVWRGQTIVARGAGVAAFVAAEKSLVGQDIAALDRHLIRCKDAIAAVREAAAAAGQADQGKTKGAATNQMLLTYLMHIRLSRTIERTQLMVENALKEEKKYKPQDLIRLHEIMLQNFAEMQQLPGMESDKEYQKEIDLQINRNKALRCLYMCEALKTTRHFKEGHAIVEKGLSYAALAGDNGELAERLEAARLTALADAVLDTAPTTTSAQPSQRVKPAKNSEADIPVADRLDEYRETEGLAKAVAKGQASLVRFPPDLSPIPYKPLFFDVAVNHLQLPVLDTKAAGTSEQSRQGLTGFVKGLWGWGSQK